MLPWLVGAYRRWRGRDGATDRADDRAWIKCGDAPARPIEKGCIADPSMATLIDHAVVDEDASTPPQRASAIPVDHYSASLAATQHALHAALMGHSERQQQEADAVRAVDDQAEPESAATPQVFILMQFGSGYTKSRPDDNREKTIVGVYRTAVRAWRARENLRSILSARHSKSEHSYYHTIEKMDLL